VSSGTFVEEIWNHNSNNIGHVKGISSMNLPCSIQRVAYTRVVPKTKVGIWLDSAIADQLDSMSESFDGLKGDLVAAALHMFFQAEDKTKRGALKDVMGAKVDRLFDGPPPFGPQRKPFDARFAEFRTVPPPPPKRGKGKRGT
jgi:hypothetical protein